MIYPSPEGYRLAYQGRRRQVRLAPRHLRRREHRRDPLPVRGPQDLHGRGHGDRRPRGYEEAEHDPREQPLLRRRPDAPGPDHDGRYPPRRERDHLLRHGRGQQLDVRRERRRRSCPHGLDVRLLLPGPGPERHERREPGAPPVRPPREQLSERVFRPFEQVHVLRRRQSRHELSLYDGPRRRGPRVHARRDGRDLGADLRRRIRRPQRGLLGHHGRQLSNSINSPRAPGFAWPSGGWGKTVRSPSGP